MSVMRYRIVPSRGRSWHVWDRQEAVDAAEALAVAEDMSVAVCTAPEGGLVWQIHLAQRPKKPKVRA